VELRCRASGGMPESVHALAELSFPSSAVYKGLAVAKHTVAENGRPNSREIALKLIAPVSELENPQSALLAQPSARPETKSDLISAYYDTCTLALYRRGMTLRVRGQRCPSKPRLPRGWTC
jgi:hypothetical protein